MFKKQRSVVANDGKRILPYDSPELREAVTTVKWLMGVICSANVCTVEPEAMIIESFSSINLAAAVAILFFSSFRSFSFSCTSISDVNGLTGLALP